MTIEELYSVYQAYPVVTTDSRVCPSGSLFFALKGESFDGNQFAASALAKGCAYAVVDDRGVATDDRFIVVDDVLTTLRALAAHHRRVLGTKIIGVTGTNGKTTTKELTAAVLKCRYNVLYTEGNFNNHIGVPLTLLRLRPEHDIAIIEMGANHPGEIRHNVEIVRPNFGIITNVGKAHLEGFGSLEGVAKTKGELYDFIRENHGVVFCNAQNELLMGMSEGIKRVLYSSRRAEALVLGSVVKRTPYLSFRWQTGGGAVHTVNSNLIGDYNIDNLLAAACVGCYFGVDEHDICMALRGYVPTNNRSQLITTENNSLVVDAYNANPTSMEASLRNFSLVNMPHKVAILGDMLELGAASRVEHQRILDVARTAGFEQIMLVGKEFSALKGRELHFANVNNLMDYLQVHPLRGCTVLIKGSHGVHLEQLTSKL